MLKILITNDDGFIAPGLLALRDVLSSIAQVIVIAPEVDGSGFSSSLTLNHPFRVFEIDKNYYALRGTPADCVHAALAGLLPEKPDMVISGINNSANMGDDIIYSGTVAAAYEGRFLTYPSIALSMVSNSAQPHYQTGTQVCLDIVQEILKQGYRHEGVLNVNIPDIPYEQLKGKKITKVGKRDVPQPVQRGVDPRGREYFWMGARGEPLNVHDEQTDFFAVQHEFVSISPLSLEFTDHQHFHRMTELFA